MAYTPNNPNGQATAASSAPVVLASNQSAIPVTGAAAAVLALDGTDITTPTAMPAGGVGIRGWLSALYTAITSGISKSRITNGTVDAGVEPFGQLNVNTGYATLFYDSWSTSPIDTTDKWTVTGTAPTIAGGNMDMAATLSTYNAIRTKDTIRPNAGFTLVRNGVALEVTAATGCGRFHGLGTPATTPAAAVLAQDGIGYEIDQAAGSLLAVTYAGGVRTTIATLTRPTDGAKHAYGLLFRATVAYWVLDGVTVASQTFPNVQIMELPALIVRQNAASFTGTPVYTNIAHLTADTAPSNMILSDPIIGTRQARVSSGGALSVNLSGSAGTQAAVTQTISAAIADTQGTAAVTPGTGQAIASVISSGNTTFHITTSAFVGTLVFEASLNNGVNYSPLYSLREDGAGAEASTTINTAAAFIRAYSAGIPGFTHFRVRCSAFTSGTVAIYITQGPFLIETNPSLGASTASIGTVNPPAITKSTQGVVGFTTQDLKDAGRVNVAITCYQAAGIITTEALFAAAAFSRSADGATATTGQQFTVTAGKRFSIQSIIIEIKNTAAAAFTSKLVLRYLGAGGTIANTSPILGVWDLGSNNATANNYVGPVVLPIPDGMELIASSTFGFTNLSNATSNLHTITLLGYEY